MSDVSSILTKASETMQHQAPAATEKASKSGSSASDSASSAASSASSDAAEETEEAKAGIIDGVKMVMEAVTGGDDSVDDHDEL